MKRALLLFTLLFISTVGCATSHFGGGLAPPDIADELIEQVAILRTFREPDGMGNAVAVGENLILTARHVYRDGGDGFRVDGERTPVTIVAKGEGTGPEDDWILLRTGRKYDHWMDVDPIGRGVVEGQAIYCVGYWFSLEMPIVKEDLRYPVVVKGRVVGPPFLLGDDAPDVIYVDLGQPPFDLHGFSGASAMVKDAETGRWRLVGILKGPIEVYLANFLVSSSWAVVRVPDPM